MAHYNSTMPIALACVASLIGIDAVLYHVDHDGKEKPIAYASKHCQMQSVGIHKLKDRHFV